MSDAPPTAAMPGGGIARRPLHLILMADCSGSMKGEKIQSLNFAVADMLPHLAEWERDQEVAQVLVRAIAFADTPVWHIEAPVPVGEVQWSPLREVPKGRTNMGPLFRMVAGAVGPDRLEHRALRPALVLVTDGLPTDPPGEMEAGLDALMAVPGGREAVRLAVAIGRDAKSDALARFIGDPRVPVLVADSTDQITERLVAASIAVSRMSTIGADSGEVADRLLAPPAPPMLFDEDTIV